MIELFALTVSRDRELKDNILEEEIVCVCVSVIHQGSGRILRGEIIPPSIKTEGMFLHDKCARRTSLSFSLSLPLLPSDIPNMDFIFALNGQFGLVLSVSESRHNRVQTYPAVKAGCYLKRDNPSEICGE